MEWTDYTVKRDVDELKDLSWEQASKVAEMLNKREVTTKIKDLEERLQDSEGDYDNLKCEYDNLDYDYTRLLFKHDNLKDIQSKNNETIDDLKSYLLKQYKNNTDVEISNICKIVYDRLSEYKYNDEDK